jgi:hypothetical protein
MTDEKTVTLLASDVECLLLASAAVKEIEAKLVSMGRDPTFMRRKGHIEEAFNRINRARREETRVVEDPEHDALMTPDMVNFLHDMARTGAWPSSPQPTHPTIAGLLRRRMIVMGAEQSWIKWGDQKVDGIGSDKIRYRLTDRGIKWAMDTYPADTVYPTKEE